MASPSGSPGIASRSSTTSLVSSRAASSWSVARFQRTIRLVTVSAQIARPSEVGANRVGMVSSVRVRSIVAEAGLRRAMPGVSELDRRARATASRLLSGIPTRWRRSRTRFRVSPNVVGTTRVSTNWVLSASSQSGVAEVTVSRSRIDPTWTGLSFWMNSRCSPGAREPNSIGISCSEEETTTRCAIPGPRLVTWTVQGTRKLSGGSSLSASSAGASTVSARSAVGSASCGVSHTSSRCPSPVSRAN